MSLDPGTRLGVYELVVAIGAGGMGEVYRARDTKLGRDVAIKVLPPEVAEDADRLARFKREAQVLAALNHPHIAAIHGLEEADTSPFLVLELVEGEDLSERLARGPIPLEEAIELARQIAEALEAAHAKGIVHRDLKPANIRVTAEGDVKVLDFGLAKAYAEDSGDGSFSDLSQSPTMAKAGTQAGVILGTAAYMSPEQARGKAVDKRTDIWAFGVVLYEMLTGQKLFTGETLSDTLAGILKTDPDWTPLPADVPRSVRRLLERCLERNPKNRLHDIADARLDLDAPPDEVTALPPVASRAPWIVTGAFALVSTILTALYLGKETTPNVMLVAEITPPEGTTFSMDPVNPGLPALSPDGTMIAFTAAEADGRHRLYVRSLIELADRAIDGTDQAAYPFWSPDSRTIGFFAESSLKTVEVDGGPVETIADLTIGKGGTWNERGDILFAPSSGSRIHRVAESGGESTAITVLDSAAGHNSHRHPKFLPDGHHFLFLARSQEGEEANTVFVGSLDETEPKPLLRANTAAIYASEHLVFARGSRLLAQPFDVERLELLGEASAIVDDVHPVSGTGMALFAASATGLLIYQTSTGEAYTDQLQLLDAEGKTIRELGAVDAYTAGNELGTNISPDGRLVALAVTDQDIGTHDLWLYDLESEIRTRFTFDPGEDLGPQWSPDGSKLFFFSNRGADVMGRLYSKDVNTETDPEEVFESGTLVTSANASLSGKLTISVAHAETGFDIWVVPANDESSEAHAFLETEFDEFGALSPDGRFMLIQSDQSGRHEIYVAPYPGPGRRWQVSQNGGLSPRWRADGRVIFFQELDGRVVSADIDLEAERYQISNVTTLFEIPARTWVHSAWWPSRDGQQFFVARAQDQPSRPLTLVVNWTRLLSP